MLTVANSNQDFTGQNFPINLVDTEGLPPTLEDIVISMATERSLMLDTITLETQVVAVAITLMKVMLLQGSDLLLPYQLQTCLVPIPMALLVTGLFQLLPFHMRHIMEQEDKCR